ncbi:hypothetical protein [Capnocytophaga gingivalis]|uniref:Uncharacterized protein n=1 Tax=Capnocytophaga gingivalis TaxID=1017 RepID=A0ABU5Z7Y6_9FLAO|nr:hypothetical protein [Capnocytophaga gingivalis]MEB3075044.1 hypothetical protein [Capnocytophaga gingivalis]
MENLKKHIEELNNIIYQRVVSGDFVLKKCHLVKNSINKEYSINIDGVNLDVHYEHSVWDSEMHVFISEPDYSTVNMNFLPENVEFNQEEFINSLESQTKNGAKEAIKNNKLKKLADEKEVLLKKIEDIEFQIESLE